MQGDARVIEFLNEQLSGELTAINQYFLHAKMQENWGFVKLAAYTKAESIDEMKHAEILTDRILFLEGLPNFQRIFPLRIGQTLQEIFESDLAVEHEARNRLIEGAEYMRSVSDITGAGSSRRSSPTRRRTSTTSRPRSSCSAASVRRSTSPSSSSSPKADPARLADARSPCPCFNRDFVTFTRGEELIRRSRTPDRSSPTRACRRPR